MANSLGRRIEQGEVVVLAKKHFKKEHHALEQRVVVALHGNGMSEVTAGQALSVRFVCDGEESRWSGYDIDPKETEKYQQKHGKFLAAATEA